MNFSHRIIFCSLIFTSLVANGQIVKVKQHTHNKEYEIGPIPSLSDFRTLTRAEKEMNSLFKSDVNDSVAQRHRSLSANSFANNRARILLYEIKNGRQLQKDVSNKKGTSAMCVCALDADTMEINMALGFFGGVGVKIKVYENKFSSWTFQENDNVENLKTSLADTSFNVRVWVENKNQYLVFDRQPDFRVGQQVTGYFTYTSRQYFEKNHQSIDTISISGKIHFTCQPGQTIKNLKRL